MRSSKILFNKLNFINKSENIFKNIDSKLAYEDGMRGTIEYIFTKPNWITRGFIFKNVNWQSANNPYGHGLVRYKYFDENEFPDKIMNVCGQKNTKLINFFNSHDYLFKNEQLVGNEQGGVFKRSFISVRIDYLENELVATLDSFYQELAEKHIKGQIKFTMISHLITNPLKKFFNLNIPLSGNCAYFTGLGLKQIGLVKETSSFPLFLWFKLLYQIKKNNNNYLSVISYRSIGFLNEPKGALLHPFYWLRNSYKPIWNLDKFANIIVQFKQENDIYTYEITKNEKAIQNIKKIYNKMKKYIIN